MVKTATITGLGKCVIQIPSVSEKGVGRRGCSPSDFRFSGDTRRLIALTIILIVVACAELPELARLADNPDNDFTVPSYVLHADAEIAAASSQVVDAGVGSRVQACVKPVGVSRPPSMVRGAGDLLLLYSILRT